MPIDLDGVESLTSIVSAALESRGVLAKIRAELRANVFAAIHEEEPVDQRGPEAEALARLRSEPAGELALHLVRDLLSTCGLAYTTSVLLPEACLLPDAAALDRAALAGSLGVPTSAAEDGTPLLVSLLRSRAGGTPPLPPRPSSPPPLMPSPAAAASSQRPGLSSAKPLAPAGRRGAGHLSDLPPLGGGASASGLRLTDEEQRLDALESKLAGLAGLQLEGAGGEGDEIDEEIEDEFEEDDDDDAHGLTASRRFDASVDESVSPGRLARLEQRFDHSEEALLPRG